MPLRAHCFAASLALGLASACGADVQEVAPGASSGTSDGSTTDLPGGDTSPSGSAVTTATKGTDDGGSASDGSASGGTTSSDGSAGDTTAASAETGPSSASGSTGSGAGVSETSNGSTSTTSPVGSSTSPEESTTGPDPAGYPACPTGDDNACPAGYNCIPIVDDFDNILASYCGSMDCTVGMGADCEAPIDGNAQPQCLQFSTPVCTLSCGGGQTCPTGMKCESTQDGWLCAWPA